MRKFIACTIYVSMFIFPVHLFAEPVLTLDPNEIEDVIVSHQDIIEAAAIGVPDDKTGEAIKVFIVSRNTALTLKDVQDYCRSHLTAYKVPKQIEFRDELPKTNVGKVLRRTLRDEELSKNEKAQAA